MNRSPQKCIREDHRMIWYQQDKRLTSLWQVSSSCVSVFGWALFVFFIKHHNEVNLYRVTYCFLLTEICFVPLPIIVTNFKTLFSKFQVLLLKNLIHHFYSLKILSACYFVKWNISNSLFYRMLNHLWFLECFWKLCLSHCHFHT